MKILQVFGLAALMALPGIAFADKAASYRQEATYHREMAENYRKNVAPPVKGQSENPWARKMARHCKVFIDDAEKMAADADKAAEYHTLRAQELSGK